ncbi:MAG: four helix bundle protein [Chitinophagales bacterium]|nr:four helix bundle protein [Chitinophagales bacterium]MBP9136632.1 four helix bundle protein [Chitinophagales bacterium]
MEEGSKIASYKNLIVWQKAIEFVTVIYKTTKLFPSDEKFNLITQINRAVISVPVNIAEGYGRESSKNYLQFLRISRGSILELETLLLISKNLNYLPIEDYEKLTENLNEISKLLQGLIKSIQNKIAIS